MNLNAALQLLDPEDDTHWTDMGLPRLDALRELTTDNVSRQAINAIAPKFRREANEVGLPVPETVESNQLITVPPKKTEATLPSVNTQAQNQQDINSYVSGLQDQKLGRIKAFKEALELIEAAGLTEVAVPRISIGPAPKKPRRRHRG